MDLLHIRMCDISEQITESRTIGARIYSLCFHTDSRVFNYSYAIHPDVPIDQRILDNLRLTGLTKMLSEHQTNHKE